MRNAFLLIYIIVSVVLSGCNSNNNINSDSNTITLSINNYNVKEKVILSSLIEDYQIVPLQTDSSCFLGRINKVIFFNNHYFILDMFSTKKLLEFDEKGNFIRQYGKQGDGPGEYFMILDFTIIDDRNEIVITDGAEYIFYDTTGKFIKRQSNDFLLGKLEYCGNNHIANIGGGRDDNLIISDTSGKRLSSFFPYIERPINVLLTFPLLKLYNSNVTYSRYLNDTIYKIITEKNEPVPYIIVDFGDNAFSLSKYRNLKNTEKNNLSDYFSKTEYCIKYNFFETENTILIYFSKHNKSHISVFSKKDNSIVTFTKQSYINDISFEQNSLFYPIGLTRESFIFIIEPYKLIEDFSKIKRTNNNAKNYDLINKLINKINNFSNPLLLKIKFKNNTNINS